MTTPPGHRTKDQFTRRIPTVGMAMAAVEAGTRWATGGATEMLMRRARALAREEDTAGSEVVAEDEAAPGKLMSETTDPYA